MALAAGRAGRGGLGGGPDRVWLARALAAAGFRCEVLAPSKPQRPAGNRVKTANDALHLVRLPRLGEISSMRVPSVAEEAARDLVRAHDDVRGELMRARHRVSKLLLRQGVVYGDGWAWTLRHRLFGCVHWIPVCPDGLSRS